MDTKGHAKIAEEVGLGVLADALAARGYRRTPLNAFALGNWLADVQQAIDPVAAHPEVLKARIGELLDELVRALRRRDGKGLIGAISSRMEKPVQDLRAALFEAIDILLASTTDPPDPRRRTAFDALRALFRVVGYFRFVQPLDPDLRLDHEPATGDRMDYQAYLAVFAESFKQYYPHDHIDRPEVPSRKPPDFRTDLADGPLAVPGAGPTTPDLYRYMREDIEIAAGRLAEAERDWAQALFDLHLPPRPKDPEWNVALAKLGQAMHTVEDFFAHSTFAEHAAQVLGVLPRSSEATAIVTLRLRRWEREVASLPPERRQTAPEPQLVTGFFELQDTALSLIHMLEELFGIRFTDPELGAREALEEAKEFYRRPDIMLSKVRRLLFEVSEILNDADRALADRDNETAQRLREEIPKYRGTVTKEKVKDLLVDSPLFRELGPEGKPELEQDIINALLVLHAAYQLGDLTYSAYKALRTLQRFLDDPFETVLQSLRDVLGDKVKNLAFFYANQRVEALLGARRIGSHSLIAKDHDTSPLHAPAWNCAAAVHWYVMHVLTRQHPALKGTESGTARSVDWFELLEFFLRHPRSAAPITVRDHPVCVTIEHVVDNVYRIDSLATLADMYRPTACSPHFTWRMIADANFATQELSDEETRKVVNRVLGRSRRGYLVQDRINYAFNPGVTVLIPNQKRMLQMRQTTPDIAPWWKEVVERAKLDNYSAWKVLSGFEDPEGRMSREPLDTGHVPILLTPERAAARISAAARMRETRERAFSVSPSLAR